MEENWDTVRAFLACQTQWRRYYPPMGGPVIWDGLRYEGVQAVIHAYGHHGETARRVFAGIQTMEAAALGTFHSLDTDQT